LFGILTTRGLDDYSKASTEAYTRAVSVLSNMATLVSSFLASAYVIFTIYSISKIAALFSFLPFLGHFVFGKITNRIRYNMNMDNVPFKRRQDYVNRAIYLQKYSKEIRLSNIFNALTDIYDKAYKEIISNINKYSKKIFIIDYIKGVLCFPIVFEGVWLYAAYCAMVSKTIQIEDFVVLASAIVSTTWMLTNFSNSITASFENGLYINNLKTFLNYKEKISEDQQGIILNSAVESIEFKNVSFTYDGQSELSLKDVNLVMLSGRKVDLVGHNGAGKSTLIKLIMRLYDPTEGVILLNGINIKEYNLKEYRKLIGTIFQDYQILSMTVLENVMMNSIDNDADRKKAINALKKSDIYDKVQTLVNGEDTILTREFDDNGAILSGGKYQKIAMARAIVKENPIIILDEPSSALDPIAEYEMYETIMDLCNTYDQKKRQDFCYYIPQVIIGSNG
jgi:ATP-binding cassette subfamily B protein